MLAHQDCTLQAALLALILRFSLVTDPACIKAAFMMLLGIRRLRRSMGLASSAELSGCCARRHGH